MRPFLNASWPFRRIILSAFLAVVLAGCATTPPLTHDFSEEDLFAWACEPGKDVRVAQGNVRLKLSSVEVSGQFPASVQASPDRLRVEVGNFLGGTEALMSVDRDHYLVTGAPQGQQRQPDKKGEGNGSWGGIPLHWATDLFLGKIPCPSASSKVSMHRNSDGQLVVEVKAESPQDRQTFVFGFRRGLSASKLWPESLHWENGEPARARVDFKFDDPENGTLSPKKWDARSDKGVVRVSWGNRHLTRSTH